LKERLASASLQTRHQDPRIVYSCTARRPHAFSPYHPIYITRSRVGRGKYFNSNGRAQRQQLSEPSASILDTRQSWSKINDRSGLAAAKVSVGEPQTLRRQVVLSPSLTCILEQSVRLRISETYTAPAQLIAWRAILVFDRSLGRPRNAVVLPKSIYCQARFARSPQMAAASSAWTSLECSSDSVYCLLIKRSAADAKSSDHLHETRIESLAVRALLSPHIY